MFKTELTIKEKLLEISLLLTTSEENCRSLEKLDQNNKENNERKHNATVKYLGELTTAKAYLQFSRHQGREINHDPLYEKLSERVKSGLDYVMKDIGKNIKPRT